MSIKEEIKENTLTINLKKSLHEITITEVAKATGISRTTFYAHYDDVYSVIEDVEQGLFTGLRILAKDLPSYHLDKHHVDNPLYVDRQIFEFIQENAEAFKVLLGEHGDPSFRHKYARLIQENAIDKMINDLHINKHQNFLASFCVSGLISIVEEWLFRSPEVTPEEMERISTKLLYGSFLPR